MKKSIISLGAMLLPAVGVIAQERPNIIVILADDLGFSDLGCYGGEIKTPNLDQLASQGIRLTQMYNPARSCPSRASLMTGLYPHQTGLGHMDDERKSWPKGYAGFRNDDNVTIAEVLKEAGYKTAMSGKWHLGKQFTPIERGFDEFYGLLGGFTSFWDSGAYTRLPKGRSIKDYGDDFYATHAITDYAIDFINEAQSAKQPLFLYLAYNAPHFPLHAPKAVTDQYEKIYQQGWDKIRDERWKRIAKMGLMQGNLILSPRGKVLESFFQDETKPLPTWDSLSLDQQKDLARRMAIFAAMVDIMDRNIGRIVKTLKDNQQLENTFIVFLSDNGACAEWHEFGFDNNTGIKYHTHTGKELDGMGLKGTYHHYGTGWANVCNTPLSEYKHYAREGGISTPCIVSWGGHIKKAGVIDHTPTHISDIMATCVDLAGTKYPKTYRDKQIIPMAGYSICPLLNGGKYPKRYVYAEHEGNRMVRFGDWKLVSEHHNQDEWELYNIAEDRTEQNNLAGKYPKKLEALEKAYFKWAEKSDVQYFPHVWNQYNKSKNQKPIKEYKTR